VPLDGGGFAAAGSDTTYFTGIKVHAICLENGFDDVMDTVFHEIAHFDPDVDAMWTRSETYTVDHPYTNDIKMQNEIHKMMQFQIDHLMDRYRDGYKK
jgi:hypothetical protein